ncbi:MAG: 4-(cytidine 5'-diphospho)-2-C-methyl-D-erythritol kinase [Pseudomonadota bacterium]
MTKVEVFAPAKVNLTLHIIGQRADGYHLLDSLVAFAPVGDILTLERSRTSALTVSGPEAVALSGADDNLVLRAAAIFDRNRGAQFALKKTLPLASGIGGGSSDAAAALRGLARLYPDASWRDILNAAPGLGADVPMCLAPGPSRVGGIGDEIQPIDLPVLPAVLVNPRVSVSTAAVFQGLRQKSNPPMEREIPRFSGPAAFADWCRGQRNDLEPHAVEICSEVKTVLAAIRKLSGTLLARMSGSGATCIGLFADMAAADRAAQDLALRHPDWWIKACELGDMRARSAPVPMT